MQHGSKRRVATSGNDVHFPVVPALPLHNMSHECVTAKILEPLMIQALTDKSTVFGLKRHKTEAMQAEAIHPPGSGA
jgi:hypothetical protein